MGLARILPKDQPKRSRPLRNPPRNQSFAAGVALLTRKGCQVAYPDSLNVLTLLMRCVWTRLLLGHFLAGMARKDLLTWFDGRVSVVDGHRNLTIAYDN